MFPNLLFKRSDIKTVQDSTGLFYERSMNILEKYISIFNKMYPRKALLHIHSMVTVYLNDTFINIYECA